VLRSEIVDGSDRTVFDSAVVIDEPRPQVHAKTWLALLGVGLIYSAQLFSLVGAGVVSASLILMVGTEILIKTMIARQCNWRALWCV
jgi:hypothetical protein